MGALTDFEVRPQQMTFGERLIAAGKLSREGLERAERLRAQSGERLEPLFSKLGLISERDLAEAMAAHLNLTVVRTEDFPDTPVLEDRLGRKFLKRARVIPLEDRTDGLVVAMADPFDTEVVDAVRFAIEKPALPCVACPADIDAAYERLYGGKKAENGRALDELAGGTNDVVNEDVERLKDLASEAPVIRLVNAMIARAVEARASDIHIEPVLDRVRVRYRIDGVLHEIDSPPAQLRNAIVSRIKIMARLTRQERSWRKRQPERMKRSIGASAEHHGFARPRPSVIPSRNRAPARPSCGLHSRT